MLKTQCKDDGNKFSGSLQDDFSVFTCSLKQDKFLPSVSPLKCTDLCNK